MTSNWSIAAALLLTLVGVLHSVLGERFLLGPLIRDLPRVPLGSAFAKRTLRAAWHLTTVALWGVAAVIARPEAAAMLLAVTLLATAVLLGVWTRGAHFAWPLFAAAAIMTVAAHAAPVLEGLRVPVAYGLAALLGAIALLHTYWAAGGRWAAAGAIPSGASAPRFVPGPVLTLGVAVALAALGSCALVATELVLLPDWVAWARGATVAGGVVFVLRAFGEGRYVGFFKRRVGTVFARRDTAIYTPVCVCLSMACFVVAL